MATEASPTAAPAEPAPLPTHGAPMAGLGLAALGVVFGDIGTSPLYALQTVFSADHNAVTASREHVFGVISMVFWSITIIVSYAYASLMLRADNEGEGGILSLVALLRAKLASRPKLAFSCLVMGILGASLFYGDSIITPAISLMSSIEGMTLVDEGFESLVLPISLVIVTVLFAVQRFGTGFVGRFFGPVMAVWFVTLAVLGLPHVVADPEILAALSPYYALHFILSEPLTAFIAMGAVVLTVTGVEALYADMGHFGRAPIRLAWFALVFPALVIVYLGMGAMILKDPTTVENPFFHLAPGWGRVPLVILSSIATVIASQAVISGAFSVARQASRSGLLPRLDVVQTSREEGGQIYIGAINWILYIGVVLLIGIFQSSAGLANAYGLAVTGTLLLEITVFLILAHFVWQVKPWKIVVAVALIVSLELVFLLANLTKLFHGGWLPLLIAGIAATVMWTWRQGQQSVDARRREIEGPLSDFIDMVRSNDIQRVPGLAVFPHPNADTTPLALRQTLELYHVLHEHIAIVSIINEKVPHIRHVDRASVDDLGHVDDGIIHISYRVGFNDSQYVPAAVQWANDKGPEMDLDADRAHYFLSSLRLTSGDVPSLPAWRRVIFLWLSANAASRTADFHLPPERTAVVGSTLEI